MQYWLWFHNLFIRTLGDYDVLIDHEPPESGCCGSTICAAESHASRGRSEHAAREVNLGPSLMQAHFSSCYKGRNERGTIIQYILIEHQVIIGCPSNEKMAFYKSLAKYFEDFLKSIIYRFYLFNRFTLHLL